MHDPVDSLEAFYAYALAIEREAAERYREFTAYFTARGEAVLAALCDMLARMEAQHFAELSRAAEGLELAAPDVAAPGVPREDGGEGGPRKAFYRIQDPQQLLEIALDGEMRAQAFFEWASRASGDAVVRSLALEMAREEERHIRWITQAIAFRKPLRA